MTENLIEKERCEGCGKPFGNKDAPYVTLDDVWLCRECYEAVPIVGPRPIQKRPGEAP